MARSKSRPDVRRTPARDTALTIVDAILGAASLLLVRDGLQGLTTNAVARVAGVSVGSLYQYFPDKHAIVAELARREEVEALAIVARESARLANASAKEAVSRVTHLSLEPVFGTNEVRRALLREVPRRWFQREALARDRMVTEALTAYFTLRSHELRRFTEIRRAMFMIQHAVEGVAEAILLASPGALKLAAVQDELFQLGWRWAAPEGDDGTRPVVDTSDLPVPDETADADMVRRLLDEPSHRRSSEARAATTSRARETRAAILRGAERVLVSAGLSGMTARAIAREAGVASGALYHHFAGVPGIVAALAHELEVRIAADLERRLNEAHDARSIGDALVGAYSGAPIDPVAHRALLLEVPPIWTEEPTIGLRGTAIEPLAQALERHASELRRADPALMAFMALHAVKSVIESYVLLEPEGITRDGVCEELRELAARYFTRA